MVKLNGDTLRMFARKSILWSFLGLGVVAAGFWFWSNLPSNSSSSRIVSVKSVEKEQNNPLLQVDPVTGLPFWEKKLYEADPTRPLLNGSVYNPNLVSAENVKEAGNLTDTIFREMMKNGGMATLLQQDSGSAGAVGAVSQKIKSLLNNGLIPQQEFIAYTTAGAKISPDISKEAVLNYLEKAQEIIEKNSQTNSEEDDLDVFLKIVESEQYAQLKQFAVYRQNAEKTALELRLLPVPQNLEWFHTKQIWLFEESARQLKALEKAEQDPAGALAAVPARVDLKVEAVKFYQGDLANWLKNNGLI